MKKDINYSNNINKSPQNFNIKVLDGVTYIDGYLIVNKSYALPEDFIPNDTYQNVQGIASSTTGINKKAYENFLNMQSDAKESGINIYIQSGYRSYGYQKKLYEKYVSKDGVLKADQYSARAGHSEHQSGLAFDLNTIMDKDDSSLETKWVLDNAYKYGFILRYPENKELETGYMYEWWHLRYVGFDLSKRLYNMGDYITLEEYFGIDSKYAK